MFDENDWHGNDGYTGLLIIT